MSARARWLIIKANWLLLTLLAALVPCTVKVYEPSVWAGCVGGAAQA